MQHVLRSGKNKGKKKSKGKQRRLQESMPCMAARHDSSHRPQGNMGKWRFHRMVKRKETETETAFE
jgi:hypothetical protein